MQEFLSLLREFLFWEINLYYSAAFSSFQGFLGCSTRHCINNTNHQKVSPTSNICLSYLSRNIGGLTPEPPLIVE